MLDTDKVQECLEALGQGNGVNAGRQPQRDLTQLASGMVHLDFDLRTILLDCVILGRHYWKGHNLPLIFSLHCSLAIMHNLLSDLNRIQPSLDKASLGPSTLRDLFNNWIRFRRSIRDMQISLQHTHMRRKIRRS
jgi:hypothetical protein